LLELLIFDVFVVGIPVLTYFFPPKSRYAIYGYRTPRAFKSNENWHFAQRFFSKRWVFVAIIVLISQVVMLVSGLPLDGDLPVIPLVSLGEFFIGSLACLLTTELALKRFERGK
jgi:uncharacterized membrane protein